ncbi:MAG TPA: dicarboxylate/amino acid:cation symporter, partial [Planctomycetota bacterium]|nr:dicarboxylate/amino acid:cation symporter [Planctomycetota bacterium]
MSPPHRPRARLALHTRIVLGLLFGAAAGIAANQLAPGAPWVRWIGDNVAGPAGQVFLRLLLMTVVPLVFASIALGVASLGNLAHVGRIGALSLGFFVFSSVCAAVLGLTLVGLFEPGSGVPVEVRDELLATYRTQAEGLRASGPANFGVDTFLNIVPRNPIRAAADMDMLAVLFTAAIFGAALTLLPEQKSRPILDLLDGLVHVVLRIIDFAMRLAPYGVFGLIFVVTSRFGWDLLGQLGGYVAVVLGGLALHALVVISTFVRVLGGMNPLTFWRRIRASVVTAFSTSSSSATLPTNLAVAERELGIPPRIAGFVLPLGATMNMNGTALYEGVTVLFLASLFGVELSLAQQVMVVALSVLTAIGAAGVPGGSLPLLMMVLATVGVPAEGIAIVVGVDRILDMSRTVVNIAGDLAASLFVARREAAGA